MTSRSQKAPYIPPSMSSSYTSYRDSVSAKQQQIRQRLSSSITPATPTTATATTNLLSPVQSSSPEISSTTNLDDDDDENDQRFTSRLNNSQRRGQFYSQRSQERGREQARRENFNDDDAIRLDDIPTIDGEATQARQRLSHILQRDVDSFEHELEKDREHQQLPFSYTQSTLTNKSTTSAPSSGSLYQFQPSATTSNFVRSSTTEGNSDWSSTVLSRPVGSKGNSSATRSDSTNLSNAPNTPIAKPATPPPRSQSQILSKTQQPQPRSPSPREIQNSEHHNTEVKRKPHYSALLRAHDSIRLKSGAARPIRSRSASHRDDDQSDDDVNDKYECNQRNSEHTNERAIDVRRVFDSTPTTGNHNKDHDQEHLSSTYYDGLDEDGDSSHKSHNSLKRSSKLRKSKNIKENTKNMNFRSINENQVRLVRIQKMNESDSSFGVTVRVEDGNIVVARIMAGGLIDRQGGILQVGDIILAVDNHEVYTPEQLQEQLRKKLSDRTNDEICLKIVPCYREELPTLCVYLRALFSYDANEDSLLPCRELGVSFQKGDILEVVNQEDPNWWQARRVDSENLQTGLIPSQELEERRRAFILPDFDYATKTSICGTKVTRKRKKTIYSLVQNNDFDRAELQLYEEVCRTPAFERRTLVLIGANGVGKQSLKARLIAFDPDRFGAPLPHTSRPMRDGEIDKVHYNFVADREQMAQDIIDGQYLEWGEYDGHFYGTKFDSIRQVIGSGKMCVLDCNPTCLKILKTSDYLPFVVFIGAPNLDQLRYMHEWNKTGPGSTRNNSNYATTLDRVTLSRQSRRARTLQSFAFDFFEEEDLQATIEESARMLRIYENYFDLVLINSNFEKTFEQLRESVDALSTEPQWIPISWIYQSVGN